MAHHAEMFFRDVADEAADEIINGKIYQFEGFWDFVFENEADSLFFKRIGNDFSFRKTRTLSITANITSSVAGIIKFFSNPDIPDDSV